MDLSTFSLTDRVAIVTGAGSGIGKAISLGFAKAGANLVIAELDVTAAKTAAGEIQMLGRKALVLPVDARNADQVTNMAQAAVKEFGRIDILVNNVGSAFGLRSPFLDMSEENWDKVIGNNLKTTFLCSKAVGRVMTEQGKGSIINIGSVAGLGAYPEMAHYAAAKAAIFNLTLTLAMEWATYHVRVNAIAPGYIDTPTTKERYQKFPSELRQEQLRRIPLGHFGQAEDVAGAAIYLAADASDYVTGQVIVVGGGLTSAAGNVKQKPGTEGKG